MLPGVTEVHGEAMTRCIRAFESLLSDHGRSASTSGGSGRTLLIAAPRAGFGKSHLVGRVRAVTESLIAPVALPFDPARKVAWETMLQSVFNQYRSARCPQHPTCSLFEEAVRYFQSQMVRAAIEHGVIDEKEIPETEVALRIQFRDVFDPKASTRMVPWLTKRSPEIMDAVANPLGQRWRLSFEDLVFWNRFFQDASRPKTTAFEQLHELEGAMARDRMAQFLRIASGCRPVAFIADHLDGFFGSDSAGMMIAEILTELRFAVPRSVTLLCLNEDVWQSIFEGRIPTAWIDRLTGEAAPLGEMTETEAEAMLVGRLRESGCRSEEIADWMRRHREICLEAGPDGLYPREILRRAARAWDRDAVERAPLPRASEEDLPRTDSGLFSGMVSPFSGGAKVEPEAPAPKGGNVFSSVNDEVQPDAKPAESLDPQDSPTSRPSPFTSTTPVPPITPSPKPPMPAAPEKSRMDDSFAAARAAGIDPSRGLTNIDAIIADIRGGGARALSETQSPTGAPEVSPRQQMSFSPPPSTGDGTAPPPPQSSAPSPQGGTRPANPFWAKDTDNRLRELESQTIASFPGGKPTWQPPRIEQVIRTVGGQFPAVSQNQEWVEQRSSLTWTVRGAVVRMGFEAPENFAYWSQVLDLTIKSNQSGKVVLFSHESARFSYEALTAMGADPNTAMRYLDVIELTDADLTAIYASDDYLREAEQHGQSESALRMVARHLDGLWRRIGRPLSNAGAAG